MLGILTFPNLTQIPLPGAVHTRGKDLACLEFSLVFYSVWLVTIHWFLKFSRWKAILAHQQIPRTQMGLTEAAVTEQDHIFVQPHWPRHNTENVDMNPAKKRSRTKISQLQYHK